MAEKRNEVRTRLSRRLSRIYRLSSDYYCYGPIQASTAHPYDDPRQLTCLHSFCRKCLTVNVVGGTRSITCRICKEKTILKSTENVSDLPVNVRLLHEMQASGIMKKANSISCEECIADPPAVSYCTDCQQFICHDCCELHKKRRKLINHKLIRISDLTIQSLLVNQGLTVCSRHPEESNDYFCINCQTVNCSKCILTNHSGHACTDINVIVGEKKNKLEEYLLPLNDALSQIQSSYASVHNAEIALKKQVQDAEQSINESFDVLFAALKNRKETFLKELEQSSDIEQNKIQVERSTLANKEKQFSSSVKLVESVLANYSPEELIGSYETFEVYLEKKLRNFHLAITERNVKLSVDNKHLLSQINHFGRIEFHGDHQNMTIVNSI